MRRREREEKKVLPPPSSPTLVGGGGYDRTCSNSGGLLRLQTVVLKHRKRKENKRKRIAPSLFATFCSITRCVRQKMNTDAAVLSIRLLFLLLLTKMLVWTSDSLPHFSELRMRKEKKMHTNERRDAKPQ